MKILYYDCFSGISGDMNLAAMIDLGVDPDRLRSELSELNLDAEFELKVTRDERNGITGTRVDVLLMQMDEKPHHRNLKDIENLISESDLANEIRNTGIKIFRRLAEAEARVHGKEIHEIHFHEVGATDAIVDIMGAAICRHLLDVDAIWASSVELGGGFVTCAHGILPVPAPATVELLTGCPTSRGAVQHETTTPTGAAVLTSLADRFTDTPNFSIEKTGHGIGHRDTDIPNLLRVHLATFPDPAGEYETQPACLLQCNIDDMTAEMLGAALDLFMAEGAMDVHFTPIIMKKNRPATCMTVLCGASDEHRFKNLLFTHTTTLGIKRFFIEKTVLPVTFETIETPLGAVTMKNAMKGDTVLRSKPELENCRELARRHNLPLTEVFRIIGRVEKT